MSILRSFKFQNENWFISGQHHPDGHACLRQRIQRHGHQLQREVFPLKSKSKSKR
jgi:hypothetical protein